MTDVTRLSDVSYTTARAPCLEFPDRGSVRFPVAGYRPTQTCPN